MGSIISVDGDSTICRSSNGMGLLNRPLLFVHFVLCTGGMKGSDPRGGSDAYGTGRTLRMMDGGTLG